MPTLLYKGVPSNPENGLRVRLGHQLIELDGAHSIGQQDAQFLGIDPGGAARTVTMPQADAAQGSFFCIKNIADADEDLDFEDSDAGSLGAVKQGEMAFVVCDGSTWVLFVLSSSE